MLYPCPPSQGPFFTPRARKMVGAGDGEDPVAAVASTPGWMILEVELAEVVEYPES